MVCMHKENKQINDIINGCIISIVQSLAGNQVAIIFNAFIDYCIEVYYFPFLSINVSTNYF